MAYFEEKDFTNQKYVAPTINHLSDLDLKTLDAELQQFMENVTIEHGGLKTVEVLNESRWLKSRGALTEDGHVVITNYQSPKYTAQGHLKEARDCDPILYEQCMEDLRQWKLWKGKNEWIEKKRLESLETLAQGMRIQE